MPTQTIILNASGLITSPNELSRDEGSLTEASNILIRRDGIIEQRRGYNLYGTELPDDEARVKQLTTYRNRILRHYADKIAFDSNGAGAFFDFSGSVSETQSGLRIKFVESNGNLYFTTSDGVKKISARNPDDFTTADGFITPTGAVKAVDVDGEIIYTPNQQSAFLPQDSAVAYRVVWAYKDLNENLISGAPSQRAVVGNPMIQLLIRDYMRLLDVLDNLENTPLTTARINDKNYIDTLGLTLNASASDLRTNLIALAAKLDNDIFLADEASIAPLQINTAAISSGICTITFDVGNPSDYLSAGSKIYLNGFSPVTGTLDGAQTITTVNATQITFNTTATGAVTLSSAEIHYNEFRSLAQPSEPSIPATNSELVELQDYISEILQVMSLTSDSIISASDKVITDELDVTTTATVELRITIPSGINSSYFFQVYRSSVAQATGANSFEDVIPSDELQQVYEAFPTVAELESGEIILEDVTPDAFRGANLYTNASTGEGILAANEPPPFAKDINRYRNSVFYANTRTNQSTSLNLLGVTQMIADYDGGDIPKVTISNGDVTNTYSFITGQQEITEIETVADVANSLNSKYFLIDSVNNSYYVYFETTTAIDPAIPGRTGIKVNIDTGDTANTVAQRLKDKLSTYLDDFITSVVTDTVEVINYEVGETPDAVDVDTGFSFTNTQQGRGEQALPQITEVQAIPAGDFTSSGTADYFTLNTPLDRTRYYIWFKVGTSTDPAVSGRTGLEVTLVGSETDAQVAQAIADVLPTDKFEAEVVGSVVTITNVQFGSATNATESVVDVTFTVTTEQTGALDVLLSPLASPARAVDETARSFIRVMNKNPGESVYGYYLSSTFDVPGKMLIQARSLQDENPFYILGNNDNTGLSFNPDIGPEGTITNITAASPTVITTSTAHGMLTGDQVMLCNTDSTPIIDGLWSITMISPTTFSIDLPVSVSGSEGAFIRATSALYSENEEKSNRVYFSKFQQPEAVPLINYFDVGAQDKAILRIFPMRDSLFVFKEDGLYRISGDSAPFQLELFDSSFVTIAPDSVNIANNIVYAWTTQGIQSLTEGGSSVISRKIDNIILRLQSSNYPNFNTATWALGYESDNSYIVFTVNQTTDTYATIAYRYSTLTRSWTTFDLSHACGVINPADDKMYLGATDVAYIEQERKSFDRTDYADREIEDVLLQDNLRQNNKLMFVDVTGYNIGDVITQDQTITTTQFNIMLNKLDMDPGVVDSDYASLLELEAGDNARTNLLALATKLDSDTGVNYTQFYSNIEDKTGSITNISESSPVVITSAAHGLLDGRVVSITGSDSTPSIDGEYEITVINANSFSIDTSVTIGGTAGSWETVGGDFNDIKVCYNFIMETLNADDSVFFANYSIIDNNTLQEAIIEDVNRVTRTLTLNLSLDFLVGNVTIYKSIQSAFTYSPNTAGDPVNHKHMREATLMFETRNITRGTMSFKTDLLPEFQEVEFELDGNGIFGHTPNFGDGYFGGLSNSAPFRTYVPRQCQRCRFIVVRFSHNVAREDYKILGTTLTGETGLSSRAFR